jgi:hypothetical protein
MSIHDVVNTALLVVLTLFTVARWTREREAKEDDGVKDTAQLQRTVETYCRDHKGEHDTLWREVDRVRKRYHDEIVPWQQAVSDKLATIMEHGRAVDRQFDQLWTAHDRRREPRS